MDFSGTQKLYKKLGKLGKKNLKNRNFKIISLGSKD